MGLAVADPGWDGLATNPDSPERIAGFCLFGSLITVQYFDDDIESRGLAKADPDREALQKPMPLCSMPLFLFVTS